MNSMHGSDDQKLDALFRAYRDACAAPEASANFMPNLWARIESRQRFTFSFRRMANALTTAAVALSLVLGVYMAIPRSSSIDDNQTYVEALAEATAPESVDLVNPTTLELPADRPSR
jgi:ferric-dicitrate binding protein FerR (iron transport regulator)